MSHKHHGRGQIIAKLYTSDDPSEVRPVEKPHQEAGKQAPAGSHDNEVGLTWQPIFVLVVIGLGVLIVLGKILGLF
jgi:hypothetical protein